jgi:hypothetical protein
MSDATTIRGEQAEADGNAWQQRAEDKDSQGEERTKALSISAKNTVAVELLAELERFMSKVYIFGDNGCWEWVAGRAKAGYGLFHSGSRTTSNLKTVSAHRFSYQAFVGSIPKGLTIDHLCRVRCCVNPSHLDLVTQRENVLRGESWPADQAQKTHCIHGHPFDKANTYWKKDGTRDCRGCNRERARRRRM